MTAAEVHKGRAGPADAGHRIDRVAAREFPGYSRARLQKWIREGMLTVDGQAVKPSHILAGGEHLQLVAEPELDHTVQPQDLPLRVIFEDAHLLVVDKPAGLVVHPAAGNPDSTLQNALLHHYPELGAVPRAGIVHRLDKDTSGVMVVARSLSAHASLVKQLQRRTMGRTYETVVHGRVEQGGTVDAPIGRHPRDRKRMAVVAGGKRAVSQFRPLAVFRHFSHLEVSLETGRTHQIRVHLKHAGWPLVGDPVYGRRSPVGSGIAASVRAAVEQFPRQALHARTLILVHPDGGEELRFQAALPADLVALLAVLAREDGD